MRAMEAAPALSPIIQFTYSAGGLAKSTISGQDRHAVPNLQCATTSLADNAFKERVAWLRAAFVVAKMASCVQHANGSESPNTLIWGCLMYISDHLSSATATMMSKEVQHEEKALCMLLTQTMLDVLRWAAKHHQRRQYEGKVALSMLLGVVNCEAIDVACFADLILKSGKSHPKFVVAAMVHSFHIDLLALLHPTQTLPMLLLPAIHVCPFVCVFGPEVKSTDAR